MIFSPTPDPLNNIWLSAAVASVPVVLFMLALTVLKMKGLYAALLTTVVTFFLTIFVFNLPANVVLPAAVQGVVQGIWPIGYVIIAAVWLYKLIVASGQFEVIKSSLTMISKDQRIQLLVIAFCFGAFLEGVAAFGVPIVICSVMLIALGFKPLKAASYSLIANIAPGSVGAVGIPVTILDKQNIDGVSALGVAAATNTTLPFIYFTVPFLLVFLLDGMRGIKQTLPAILVISISYTIVQTVIMQFLGAELAAIGASLTSLVAITIFSKKWQPAHIFRINENEAAPTHPDNPKEVVYNTQQIIKAWLPFVVLSVLIMIWSTPFFKGLFAAGGALSWTTFNAVLFENTTGGIKISIQFVAAVGAAIVLTNFITMGIFRATLPVSKAFGELAQTIKGFSISVATVCMVLVIAKWMGYSGMVEALGESIAETKSLFPLLSPILGWIGVFVTGSVVNNNILFANLQATVAGKLSISPSMLVAANTIGGAIAKAVSPASIAVATAGIGATGRESELLKMVLKYSLGFLAFACVWTFVVAQIIHHA